MSGITYIGKALVKGNHTLLKKISFLCLKTYSTYTEKLLHTTDIRLVYKSRVSEVTLLLLGFVSQNMALVSMLALDFT